MTVHEKLSLSESAGDHLHRSIVVCAVMFVGLFVTIFSAPAVEEVEILHGEPMGSRTYEDPWGLSSDAGWTQFAARATLLDSVDSSTELRWSVEFGDEQVDGVRGVPEGPTVGTMISFEINTLSVDPGTYDLKVTARSADDPSDSGSDVDQVLCQQITIKSRLMRDNDGQFRRHGTRICAGGREDEVHKALWGVKFIPKLRPGQTVEVSLTEGGAGVAFDGWWTYLPGVDTDRRRARVTVPTGQFNPWLSEVKTYEFGDDQPLRVTNSDGEIDLLAAFLRSSNKDESTRIVVSPEGMEVSESHVITFAPPEFSFSFVNGSRYDGWEVGKPRKITASYTFHGYPVVGHSLGATAFKVKLKDGTTIVGSRGEDMQDAIEKSAELKKYVEVKERADTLGFKGYGMGTKSTPNDSVALRGEIVVKKENVDTYYIGYVDLTFGE